MVNIWIFIKNITFPRPSSHARNPREKVLQNIKRERNKQRGPYGTHIHHLFIWELVFCEQSFLFSSFFLPLIELSLQLFIHVIIHSLLAYLIPTKTVGHVLNSIYKRKFSLNSFFLLVWSDNLSKKFGPRSGPTKCRAWYGSKLFDTLMIFLKEFQEKSSWRQKKSW